MAFFFKPKQQGKTESKDDIALNIDKCLKHMENINSLLNDAMKFYWYNVEPGLNKCMYEISHIDIKDRCDSIIEESAKLSSTSASIISALNNRKPPKKYEDTLKQIDEFLYQLQKRISSHIKLIKTFDDYKNIKDLQALLANLQNLTIKLSNVINRYEPIIPTKNPHSI